MTFSCATNPTRQGDIGEARAIYEFTTRGYIVSKPLTSSTYYDLVVDKDNILYRVQVKTTKQKSKYGVFEVDLRTSGGNSSRNAVRHRQPDDYDLLFVMVSGGECWIIPSSSITSINSISLGSKCDKYKV